jgi:hypothetical protein
MGRYSIEPHVSDSQGHYSYGVQREQEMSVLLLRDEELALPDDLDFFRYLELGF